MKLVYYKNHEWETTWVDKAQRTIEGVYKDSYMPVPRALAGEVYAEGEDEAEDAIMQHLFRKCRCVEAMDEL